ncbi:RidA family protein [Halioxenophilus aromaticivorans]|uniref:RidA family protein n=1 Tax=Halioxenophilus aromaticivorans TaxID=1306992 RepID=A0AAV3TY09_9ALTE
MSREVINPETMYPSLHFGFSHATESSDVRTIHCAGQVAWNKEGELVGAGDVAAQAKQALANLKEVLKTAGATPADVVRIRTYIVGHSPALLEPVCGAILEFYEGAPPAANTLIGVQALALPELLIEIEATAQIK